jgi:hypothetical protein
MVAVIFMLVTKWWKRPEGPNLHLHIGQIMHLTNYMESVLEKLMVVQVVNAYYLKGNTISRDMYL